ncbi:thioredoxin domain-containing protein [Clostridium fermenticellae]|uniref:Thioredoxin domain-containing protein n=1 Tax=Clostridium fermenticellae TaxID=2068654 RepID=A0A386H3S1_9CLOT|nr:thioredoxin domain-containing protein [Clostridium fermenticellae]AYD40381.1 thioredoxin domain-containing protein [Clostridium fermenticellae]
MIYEKSPYLLQHAYNPVNWYPWGEEAFEKARLENKPIFLSIGYSSCHWCHVMEKESFESDDVAGILNKNFVAVKVDREERPDIDSIYMKVCEGLTGGGGWPLTIIMTPDQKPFFAATYLPKNNKRGMQGLMSVLESAGTAWDDNKKDLEKMGSSIVNILNDKGEKEKQKLSYDFIKSAFTHFKQNFDELYGGFGRMPKFPMPHNLMFLLRYWYINKDEFALQMVQKTLDLMYNGGIYDHVGYGFSRYSTDRKWLIPHFEKMLYDNALLSIVYLEMYQIKKDKKYAKICNDIFTYILRDMTSEYGGFYSSEDADSEGYEGKFYLWSKDEIDSILGTESSKRFCRIFGVTEQGNFNGKNILNLKDDTVLCNGDVFTKECLNKLFEYREKRVHPHKDDKILTSWNGLMIAAMAIGGRVLKNSNYTDAAIKSAKFIFDNLTREDGRLLSRYRSGEASFLGYADDYAFLIWGLIELYETTYDEFYLKKALDINRDMFKYFWDYEEGGFFIYGKDGENLITRPKEIYDGAIPSGNSVEAFNLIRLSRITSNIKFEEKAVELLSVFSGELKSFPQGYSFSMMALMSESVSSMEVIIVSLNDYMSKKMVDSINSEFRPFMVSMLKDKYNTLDCIIPFSENYSSVQGRSTAYVCQNFACKLPVTNIDDFENLIGK